MNRRMLGLGGALLCTVALTVFGNRGEVDSGDGVVAAVDRGGRARQSATSPDTPVVAARAGVSAAAAPEIAMLRDRAQMFGGDANGTSALFASHNWTPPPPPPPPAQVAVATPPKPSAPPLPFVFLGKKFEDGKWEAYLGKAGETYVVREQSVVDGIYRADAITPTTLTLTYLPLKQTQRLAIGGE